MKAVLDHLIANAPEENEGAAELQIVMKQGAMWAGAVKHSEFGDTIYELITIGQNPQTQQALSVVIYFNSDDVLSVQATQHQEKSVILTPRGSGIQMPGLS
jgi:hypothetical protein